LEEENYIKFIASISPLQSAIQISGMKDGAKIKLDKVVLYPIEEAREWIVNNVSCNFNELVFKRILIDIMGAGNGESP
jgi:hypothetical protein